MNPRRVSARLVAALTALAVVAGLANFLFGTVAYGGTPTGPLFLFMACGYFVGVVFILADMRRDLWFKVRGGYTTLRRRLLTIVSSHARDVLHGQRGFVNPAPSSWVV